MVVASFLPHAGFCTVLLRSPCGSRSGKVVAQRAGEAPAGTYLCQRMAFTDLFQPPCLDFVQKLDT